MIATESNGSSTWRDEVMWDFQDPHDCPSPYEGEVRWGLPDPL